MTKGRSNIAGSTGDDEILRRLATAPELLMVCDFEGTLTSAGDRSHRPVERSMRVLSGLASLPQTMVAVISDGSGADLRTGARDGLDHRVTVIERCAEVHLGDRAGASEIPPTPRKDLAIDGLLAQHSPSLIFFAGDDASDEIVFAALGIDDIGCKVGKGTTNAILRMDNPAALVTFLGCVLRKRRSLVEPRRRDAVPLEAPAAYPSSAARRKTAV